MAEEPVREPMGEAEIQRMISNGWKETTAREIVENYNSCLLEIGWAQMARFFYLHLCPKKGSEFASNE